MIYHGDNTVQRIFVGEHEVSEVYRGRDLIWARRLGGVWRFEFQGRSGIYDLHTYAAENGRGRIDVEKTTFPFSAGHEYPGLYFVTGNPVQYSSHTVFYLNSGLLSPEEPDDIVVELDLFLAGADNGAWSVGLFGNSVGMVFDKTGLEAGLAPRLWCGQYEKAMGFGRTDVDGQKVGGFPAGRAVLWVSPKGGFVRAYLGSTVKKEIPFDSSVFQAGVPLDVRFENKAAFMLIPTPTWIPTPVPIYPPGIHAVTQYTGQVARNRLAQLGWAAAPVDIPQEVEPVSTDPNRDEDDSLWVEAVYSTVGSRTVDVPVWARSVQVVALGGGGGGSGGDLLGIADCNGGDAGQWASGTIGQLSESLTVSVGDGGRPGPDNKGGYEGHPSFVRAGEQEIRALPGGGGHGYGDPAGRSPGSHSAFGRWYRGGVAVSQTLSGNAPGGGGGAASKQKIDRIPAGHGAPGRVWLRFSSKEL